MSIKNTIEEHNLNYDKAECHYIEHNPVWDGNYYTCLTCGKEFVMKSTYTKDLLRSRDEEIIEKINIIGEDRDHISIQNNYFGETPQEALDKMEKSLLF